MFEKVDGRRTDDRRRSHWYTNSSPWSLRLRWAKKLCLAAFHARKCLIHVPKKWRSWVCIRDQFWRFLHTIQLGYNPSCVQKLRNYYRNCFQAVARKKHLWNNHCLLYATNDQQDLSHVPAEWNGIPIHQHGLLQNSPLPWRNVQDRRKQHQLLYSQQQQKHPPLQINCPSHQKSQAEKSMYAIHPALQKRSPWETSIKVEEKDSHQSLLQGSLCVDLFERQLPIKWQKLFELYIVFFSFCEVQVHPYWKSQWNSGGITLEFHWFPMKH